MTDRPAVHVGHGRTDEQRAVMEQIAKDGVDPFDWNHLADYHHSPVLRKGTYWLVTPNDTPYAGSTLHLLVIYRDRVSIPEMPSEAWLELREMVLWIISEYDLAYGALLMRFGDIIRSGASVDHPHMHIIVGGSDPGAEKLKAAVGYKEQ